MKKKSPAPRLAPKGDPKPAVAAPAPEAPTAAPAGGSGSAPSPRR